MSLPPLRPFDPPSSTIPLTDEDLEVLHGQMYTGMTDEDVEAEEVHSVTLVDVMRKNEEKIRAR